MRKKILSVLLAATMIATLAAGCSSGGSGGSEGGEGGKGYDLCNRSEMRARMV